MNSITDTELKKVVNWLRANGYYHVEIISLDNEKYVIADGRMRKMAISITTELNVSRTIENIVIKEAHNLHREPWLARINDEDENEDISWKRIREHSEL